MLVTAVLSLGTASSAWAGKDNEDRDENRVRIFAPQSHPYGKSYGEWAAAFWQWALALPLEGHPFLPSPNDP